LYVIAFIDLGYNVWSWEESLQPSAQWLVKRVKV
jgi:hypothetical protein